MGLDRPVVLDACVLAPFGVCDLLLRLAEAPPMYAPRWTDMILDEVNRAQVAKLGWPQRLADYWRQEVTGAFPEALVVGYDGLIDRCGNDPGDRHVLAAAVKAQAGAIVTFNLVHFPSSALALHAVRACHPSDFLCELYGMDSDAIVGRLDTIAAARRLDRAEVLARLRGQLPRFADLVAADLCR